MPAPQTSTLGIFQSDVIIRSALISGLANLRENPWLLDYVFASLPRDSLTAKEYGEHEVEKAKEWFLSTKIPVVMDTRVDDATMPIISIALMESSEDASTLADVHYMVAEDFDDGWPVVAGPLTPTVYNAAQGVLAFAPEAVAGKLFPGMILIDRVGKQHVIQEVLSSNSVSITPDLRADFTGALLKSSRPSSAVQLESVVFKETYSIGVHASGEPIYLTYLHSIITFILLRYKETLLEARGFERSVIGSSNFSLDGEFENELVFSRYIQVSGYVRQYWPKNVNRKVDGVIVGVGQTAINSNDHLGQMADIEIIQDLDSIDIFGRS